MKISYNHLKHFFLKVIKNKSTKAPSNFFNIAGKRDLIIKIDEIPSETSINERLFLYFFSKEIIKNGNIIELGPFLGGTTRPLALGLLHSNKNESKVFTIDQFDNYYAPKEFLNFGINLPNANSTKVPFKEIFENFHNKEDYFQKIETICFKVPDSPDEFADYRTFDNILDISGIFIDGCKSWFSIRSFAAYFFPRLKIDSYILFQDYGRFTCFWIPIFAELFPENFAFIGSIDSTYVFKLTNEITKVEIETKFPIEPSLMKVNEVEIIIERALQREIIAENFSAIVNLNIQLAGFYAYIGEKIKAKKILNELLKKKYVKNNLKGRVKEAMISPTYTPFEKVFLD